MEPYFPTAPKRSLIFRRSAHSLKALQKNCVPLSETRYLGAASALVMALAMKSRYVGGRGLGREHSKADNGAGEVAKDECDPPAERETLGQCKREPGRIRELVCWFVWLDECIWAIFVQTLYPRCDGIGFDEEMSGGLGNGPCPCGFEKQNGVAFLRSV